MTLLDSQALQACLSPLQRLGRTVELHDLLPSTSTHLSALADAGAEDGTVVVARRQSQGRGRLGRRFASPAGGLWCSILLREPELPDRAPTSLLAGLAASQALDEVARIATFLKWPNDILLDDRKIGGILVEAGQDARGPRTIVGIGLNVNLSPTAFPFLLRGQVNSLLMKTGREHDLDVLLAAVLSWLEGHLQTRAEGKGGVLLGQIADRMPMIGQRVRARVGSERIEGVAFGLTPIGALVVTTATGRRTIVAGDVEEVRRD